MNTIGPIIIGVICLVFLSWAIWIGRVTRDAKKRYQEYQRRRYNAISPTVGKAEPTPILQRCQVCGCRYTKVDCVIGICGFCEELLG